MDLTKNEELLGIKETLIEGMKAFIREDERRQTTATKKFEKCESDYNQVSYKVEPGSHRK